MLHFIRIFFVSPGHSKIPPLFGRTIYHGMDAKNNNTDKTREGDECTLPAAKPVSSEAPVRPIAAVDPTAPQNKLSAQPLQQQPTQEPQKSVEPLSVKIIEDDELNSFERKTIRYGGAGVFVAFLALLAASVTGFFIYHQFEEMNAQTGLMNRAAVQARLDAKDSALTTAQQLAALQAQITTAQNGTKALQGQLKEARRSADIAARQLELTNRAWIKIEGVKPRGNGPVIPSLSFQDINTTGLPAIRQQAFLNFEMRGKNVGFSTALNVKVIPELFLARWENGYSTKVAAEEKRFCELREKDSGNFPDTAQAVFPGETLNYTGENSGAISDETMNFFAGLPGGPYILPVLIGCVDYRFQASTVHHHVRFVYEVFHAGEPHTRFFLAGQGVKADDMLFVRNEADDYAD